MKKGIIASFVLVGLLIFSQAYTAEQAVHSGHHGSQAEVQQVKEIVSRILANNADFMKKHGAEYFNPFLESQHPKATVVSCSDSRVHVHALDQTPDNDLFVIRNIGNQVATAEGSVEYGVHHLHTPLLLIVGHVRCGAIKAALGDYSKESSAIKKELDTISIAKGGDWLEGVKKNVNNQVADAMKKFGAEVKDGDLVVVGAVYDFANDLKQGYGKLTIINVNGDTSADKIKVFVDTNSSAM